ncbi:mCG1042115 [Mus musculus]|nr:mCG1042115 [Mus musculus]
MMGADMDTDMGDDMGKNMGGVLLVSIESKARSAQRAEVSASTIVFRSAGQHQCVDERKPWTWYPSLSNTEREDNDPHLTLKVLVYKDPEVLDNPEIKLLLFSVEQVKCVGITRGWKSDQNKESQPLETRSGECAKHFSRSRSRRAMPGAFTLCHVGMVLHPQTQDTVGGTGITSALHPGSWGWNSGPDACKASTY